MTRQEKLTLLLIAVVVITRVGHLGVDLWFTSEYGASASAADKGLWKASFALITILQNMAAAVWIYAEARAQSVRAWIWSLLGLCFGVIGIVLFYAVHIYAERQPNNSSKPTPLRGAA